MSLSQLEDNIRNIDVPETEVIPPLLIHPPSLGINQSRDVDIDGIMSVRKTCLKSKLQLRCMHRATHEGASNDGSLLGSCASVATLSQKESHNTDT